MVAFVGSKCAIMDRGDKERVTSGETWRVRLSDKGTFYIAFADARVNPPPGAAAAPVTTGPPTAPTPAPSGEPPKASRAPGSDRGPMTIEGMLLEPDNVIRPSDRVAFFVDGANTDGAAAHAGFMLDWRRTIGYFIGRGVFAGAYYFATEYVEDDGQVRFHDALAGAGFTVRSKPAKLIRDPVTGAERVKGNVDIELALEMVARCDTFDVAYLFSGDSDFQRVLEVLQSRGKRIFVVTSHGSVSRELMHAADKPVYFMEDFKGILGRDGIASKDS